MLHDEICHDTHESWALLYTWLSNINQLLGDSLGVSELGHWNISNSGNLDWNLVVGIANLSK